MDRFSAPHQELALRILNTFYGKIGMKKQGRLSSIAMVACSLICPLAALPGLAQPQDAKPPKVKITTAQANKIAATKFHGKVVGMTPLENEEGKWEYGVMVRSGKTLREVMVNAMSGKIDSVEVTTLSKEVAEKKADEAAMHGKKPGKG
jgi:hypothetical protein